MSRLKFILMFYFFSDLQDKSTNTDVVNEQEVVTVPLPTQSEHVDVEPLTSSDLQPMPSRKSDQKGKGNTKW